MKFQINESEKKRIKDLYQINEQGWLTYFFDFFDGDEPKSSSPKSSSSSGSFSYDALDRFGLSSKESLDFNVVPIPRLNNIISHIKKFEEFVPFTYDDASYPPKKVEPGKSCRGTCTIGYGTTDKNKAKPGATVTEPVASAWLTDFVQEECIPCLKRWQRDTKTKVTPSIFEALIDVVYNKGCSGFRKSPIATKLENKDIEGAGKELKNWQGWGGNQNRRDAVYKNFFMKGKK